MLKRLFDILFSLTFIILFSWLFLIIALVIFIDCRFPVIYTAKRVGINKNIFTCYKFLTMKNDVITRSGKFLRKSNLDELPQFFNVLLGDMSIVGPRPHDLDEDNYFSENIDIYNKRFSVKPGITGYAGIRGNRGGNDLSIIRERAKLDLFYIKNYSFFFDLKIVLITIYLTVFRKDKI